MLVCAAMLWLVSAGSAVSQADGPPSETAQPPQSGGAAPAPPPAPQQPSPPAFAPGLIDKLGNLVKGSIDGMSSTLKSTGQTIQDINRGTVDTLTSIPVTGFAAGHAICTRADNGVPDCRTASDTLCRSKGYKAGRSLDIETAEECNPRVYLPGHHRTEGDCHTDSYVTRAACN